MSSFPSKLVLNEISTEKTIQPNIMENHNENSTQQGKSSYLSKKSINYFPPKDTFLENTNELISKRKFTLEPSINIKNFVPKPKHLEIHLVPSKMKLNNKGIRKFKINEEHSNLMNEHNCYISCPNSEESDCSSSDAEELEDQYDDLRGNNQMKQMRKIMIKNKKNVHKVLSNEVLCNKKFDNNYLNEYDLYSDDEGEKEMEENFLFENELGKERKTKRFNSCSILQILENNLKFDV